MPKKIKLTATLPDGTEATRTTARTYTHVIAGRASYDEAKRRAASPAARDQDGQNWDYYASLANGTYAFPAWYSDEARERSAADGRAFIAENPDRAAYVAGKESDRLARVEAAQLSGGYDKWHAEAWAGRRDLADKEAARLRQSPHWAEVQIVPVNG